MADELLLRGARFDVVRHMLPRRDGGFTAREVVVHPGSVVILPVTDAGEVVLIRNERHTIGRTLLEIPAGTLEPGEDPLACAAREVEEETGFQATSLEPLLAFWAAPGVSTERMHAFLATGLRPTAQRLDATERIEVHPTRPEEVLARIQDGTIQDAKTIATVLFWHTWRR